MAEENQPLDPIKAAEARFADFAYGPEEPEEATPIPEEEEVEENPEAQVSEDESDEESEEVEAKEEEEPLVEIEVDGEVLEVPERYKDYFMRHADYTQKTQEVSSQRKEVEVIRGQLEQQAKEFQVAQESYEDMLKLHGLTNQIQQAKEFISQYVQSDNFSSQQLEQYREAVRQLEEEQNSLSGELQQRIQQAQQAQEQARAELLKKGTEILKSRIPKWGEESAKQVREYALSNGFTEAEISNVADPRQVEVLWKAAQYDSLKKNAGQAVKKVQSAPSIKQKSRNPMPDETKKMLNHRKKMKNPNRSTRQKTRDAEEYIRDRFGI